MRRQLLERELRRLGIPQARAQDAAAAGALAHPPSGHPQAGGGGVHAD